MDLPLIVQGLFFSGVALLIIVSTAWWLYLSPTKTETGALSPTNSKLAINVALLLGLSSFNLVAGAFWDTSMHISTGVVPGGDDFLWPPHLMIYSSFLIALIVGLIAFWNVARQGLKEGIRDPRIWIRRNPYLGLLLITAFYALASVPGDAIWHELFGIDLTAWSPPHILLGLSSVMLGISAVGLLIQNRSQFKSPTKYQIGIFVLMALLLNSAYLIGSIEWELESFRGAAVEARPIWAYPLVSAAIPFFFLLFTKLISKHSYAATLTASFFYAVRFFIHFLLIQTDQFTPQPPSLFILGALAIDFVPWQKIASKTYKHLALAAVYTAGFALLTFPQLNARQDLKTFSPADFLFTALIVLVVSFLLIPLVQHTSRALVGNSPD